METVQILISIIIASFVFGALGFVIFTFIIKPLKNSFFIKRNKTKIDETVEWLSESEQAGCTQQQSIQALIDHGLSIKIIKAAINKLENGKKIHKKETKRKIKGIFPSKTNITEDSNT